MIAVDTNVLVRAILGDDPRQSPLARKTLEKAREVFVPITVMVELAWVLKSAGWNRSRVHEALETLAVQPTVRLDRREEILEALEAFKAGPAGFADYLTLSLSRAQGARVLLTLDRKLAKAPGTERLA